MICARIYTHIRRFEMDVAAGVFFIVAAFFNYLAAMDYGSKGKLNADDAKIGGQLIEGSNALSDERNPGRVNYIFSFYLYLTIPLLIVGAVYLFSGMSSMISVVAAIAAIFAEIVNGVMSKFGPSSTPGFIGGGLALILTVPVLIS